MPLRLIKRACSTSRPTAPRTPRARGRSSATTLPANVLDRLAELGVLTPDARAATTPTT